MIRVRTGCEYDAQSFISRVGMPRQRIFRGAVAATLICGGAIWPSISRADAGASGQPPMPPIRPPSASEPQPAGGTPPPPSTPTPSAPQPADAAACLAELKANHIEAEIVPAPPAPLADCAITEPVRVSSIGLANGAPIDMPDRPISRLRIRPHFHGVCAGSDGAVSHSDARLGHCRARYRRLPLQQPDPNSRAAVRIRMPKASPSIFRQSRSPTGDISLSAMKRIPPRPCSCGRCGEPPAAGSPPCWGRGRTRRTPSTSISTSCATGQATTIASASSGPTVRGSESDPPDGGRTDRTRVSCPQTAGRRLRRNLMRRGTMRDSMAASKVSHRPLAYVAVNHHSSGTLLPRPKP